MNGQYSDDKVGVKAEVHRAVDACRENSHTTKNTSPFYPDSQSVTQFPNL